MHAYPRTKKIQYTNKIRVSECIKALKTRKMKKKHMVWSQIWHA